MCSANINNGQTFATAETQTKISMLNTFNTEMTMWNPAGIAYTEPPVMNVNIFTPHEYNSTQKISM
jgi:hypothetical protein